jgi:cell cycle sensor histidine kinase DivJ
LPDVRDKVRTIARVRSYLDSLVHPSARHDALAAARHRAFIALRLFGSLTVLAILPLYLAVRGVPTVFEVAIFAWLATPISIAYFLSRTGRYESAHVLSSLALTALLTLVAIYTGGTDSFAAAGLMILPLEAALSASRRVVVAAAAFALLAAGGLIIGTTQGWIVIASVQDRAAFASLGVVSAVLFATGLALNSESLTRTGFWLLGAEEDRYRLLAHNMTDVITRHGRNGTVLFASPAAERLLGVSADELLDHGLFDRVHVADRPAYLSALAAADNESDGRSVEFRVRCSAAEHVPGKPASHFAWVEMRCRALGLGADGASEVVAVMSDVTKRKEQEQAVLEARADAERANTAKGRFLATMSHELRTPLNVIIGFSEMLMNEGELQISVAQRLEYAKLINDSGQHLLSVVNGILDMSKLDSGDFIIRPESFAPAEVVRSCCDLLKFKADKAGIALSFESTELCEIVADKLALKQILINLISNAIKFTDHGGSVKVSAAIEGAAIKIAVADNGIGIAADDLSRVGAPFFQAQASYDRRHDGTGLGLSIVKGLVELHAGDFAIVSLPGAGTCVTIKLPIDCEAARVKRERNVVRALGAEPRTVAIHAVAIMDRAIKKSA